MTDRGKPFIPYAFPGLPIEDAYRLAASRVQYDRLIKGQEAFLDDAARRWRSVGRLRAFLGALEDRCAGAALTAEMRSWLAWAHAHCDELDPLSAAALEDLQVYGAALRSPPDLPPRHPEEADWLDAGCLDEWLDDEEPER
ncbi:hypothetical protein [Phenylobacterium kunshanense]|uniref:Uncharacterized protein n=1 Tax=Phenylobacterium kunshanense TaxID=1445034 RepID=A0A328BIX8_9CAUL|nr:hypothetical protein [Phenylobacterium kunshanense]RAK66361.1 hypothetical protein DJ019_08930 [Phenylobacterium kunshanense]